MGTVVCLQVCKLGLRFLKKREGGIGEGAAPPPKAEWLYLFSREML